MTLQEALEYLNLPAASSEQLVQKRYLELKKDYQIAINNAPSDHFRTLYKENLDKIEEAYRYLTGDQEVTNDYDSKIIQEIRQSQIIVDTFQVEEGIGNLNSEARDRLQHYIDQISGFQESLRDEESDGRPEAMVGSVSGAYNKRVTNRSWRWEIKALKNRIQDLSTRQRSPKNAFIEKWVIGLLLNSAFSSTPGARKLFFDQLLMLVILAIFILGLIGAIYILFPLL